MENVLAVERADDALVFSLFVADALDEAEVAVPSGDLFADERP